MGHAKSFSIRKTAPACTAMHVHAHEAVIVELLARQAETAQEKDCHKNFSECDKV